MTYGSDLDQEDEDSRRPELHAALKNLYPDALSRRRIPRDTALQMAGVDAIIKFADRSLRVDYKFRSEKQTFPDFCLEFLHVYDDGRQRVGWVCDDALLCDHFIYVQKKDWTIWELPRSRLQLAWQAHGKIWRQWCVCRETRNRNYWTHWCAVPQKELESAIGQIRTARP